MPSRSSYTEDNVIDAIFDVTDNGLSQNKSAQKHGVPQQTLSRRLAGLPSQFEISQPSQRLSASQEDKLAQWILRQESLGYAPSHPQTVACVEALLKRHGDTKPLGKNWLYKFIQRHPEVKTKVGRRQEAARFNGFTPKAVDWYFNIRENEYGWIKPEHTVNVDKGGIMAGYGEI
jgi:hypothetical protein